MARENNWRDAVEVLARAMAETSDDPMHKLREDADYTLRDYISLSSDKRSLYRPRLTLLLQAYSVTV